MLLHSALCEGTLYHKRHKPRLHRFQYPTKMVWLDLDETEQLNELPFWASGRRGLVQFRREDYLEPHCKNLKLTVFEILARHGISAQQGRVVLLTQLRSWGYSFNPVSFYFCYNNSQQVYAIIAEITNTPWSERHQYVLQPNPENPLDFEFEKEFHVSPFMPMAIHYHWQFRLQAEQVLINMRLLEKDDTVFNATLNLQKKPLTPGRAMAVGIGYPFQCLRVLGAIYWQAFRLWLKRIPIYDHPKIQSKKSIAKGDA